MKNLIFVTLLGMTVGERLVAQPKLERLTLDDRGQHFDVMRIKADIPSQTILFSVGSGGDPERHLPLLTALADQGATVIAPYFQHLTSSSPSEAEIQLRANQLHIAVHSLADPDQVVAGVGHSIGATLLIALAGGHIWLGPGQQIPIPSDIHFDRLVLMCPPTGFFRAPNALDDFNTPFQAWAGANDYITPPEQVEFLSETLGDRVMVEMKIDSQANHFTFMNTLPPNIGDTHPNREDFLFKLAVEIHRYLN